MYISRNSIVIKTNYETRRRGRGVARRRAGVHTRRNPGGSSRFIRTFVRSSSQQKINRVRSRTDGQTETIFGSRILRYNTFR